MNKLLVCNLSMLSLRGSCVSRSKLHLPSQILVVTRDFSSRGRRPIKAKSSKPTTSSSSIVATREIPAPYLSIEQAWVEVKDPQSSQIYYWNEVSNETTALGAPKPTGATALSTPSDNSLANQGAAPGLGRVVAEGFAFGVGASLARAAVGSVMGMFGGDDGGGDTWST